MKKTILALALVAGLTSFAGNAKAALTWNWTETGSDLGNGSGTISVNTYYQDRGFSVSDFTGSIGGRSLNFQYASLVNFDKNYGYDSYSFTGNSQITHGNIVFTVDNLRLVISPQQDGTAAFYPLDSRNHYGVVTFSSQTAAVPEPSQVAASLLLVAGIAGFVIVRRKVGSEALAA
jgi:hypothetical protein